MEEGQSSSTKLIQRIQDRNPYSCNIKNKFDTETGAAKNVSEVLLYKVGELFSLVKRFSVCNYYLIIDFSCM